ncbi:MAG TPA: GNAT family N-acetyltransferase [Acidimicrobiales bacterium]|nr:GNAT family N-acetyltransferase [Acidimicrobiales bacterium]
MSRRRLGVVLLVPPPHDRAVDALRAAVGDPALGKVPAHLTLVPPVNVADDRMADALSVLRSAAEATRPLQLSLGPATTFLPVNPVLYLAVGGDLEDLHALRARVFMPPLERALTHGFVPHVTLADEADPARIAAGVTALADARFEVRIDRAHLLEEGDGRVWAPIADAPFTAPAVIGRGGLELELRGSEGLDSESKAFLDAAWDAWGIERDGAITRRRHVSVTARRGGEIVGVADGWADGPRADLSDLIVSGEARGQGVGSHLLAAWISRCAELGADRLSLRTRKGTPAHRFYADRGWRVVAELADWKAGIDFVQMRLGPSGP